MKPQLDATVLYEESNNGDYRKLMSFDLPGGGLYVFESTVPGAENQRLFGVGMVFVPHATVSAAAERNRLRRASPTGK